MTQMTSLMISVRDVYRNCGRLLQAADNFMTEHGFSVYDWDQVCRVDPQDRIPPRNKNNKITKPTDGDALLFGYLFHQYYADDREDHDVVTVCAAPWRRSNPESYRARCSLTRFEASATGDEVYWIGALPVWDDHNDLSGQLKEYGPEAALWEQYREDYGRIVLVGTTVRTISLPLEDITSSEVLNNRLLIPLLQP